MTKMKALVISLVLFLCYVSADKPNNCSSNAPDFKGAYANIRGAAKIIYANCMGEPDGPAGAHATLVQLVKQMSSFLAMDHDHTMASYKMNYESISKYLIYMNHKKIYMDDARRTVEYIFNHTDLVRGMVDECYDDLLSDCECNDFIAKGLHNQRHIGKLVLKLGDASLEYKKVVPFFKTLVEQEEPLNYKAYIKTNPPIIQKLSQFLAQALPYMRSPNEILNPHA